MNELTDDQKAELERLEGLLADFKAAAKPAGKPALRGPKLPVQRRKPKSRRDARRARRKNRKR